MESELLVVGSVAYDDIDTPTDSVKNVVGGAATYATVAASYFAKTRLVGVVGDDFASADIDNLKRHKIDLDGLEIVSGGKTFHWHGRYREDGSRDTIAVHLNVLETFDPKLPDNYRATPYVLLANSSPVLQNKVLEQVSQLRFVAVDSMHLWIEHNREDLLSLIKKVNLFVLNEEEARQLTGERNLIVAGKKLSTWGPPYVVIKKGEHGALLFNGRDCFVAPAFPLEKVVDPTGAGDAFIGAMMGYLAATDATDLLAVRKAMLYGAAVASYVVEGFGFTALDKAGYNGINARVHTLMRSVAF